MQLSNEARARERKQELERQSRQAQLVRELAAQRRWHRVSRYAQAAESRHARRANRASFH
jgi:hypothetical protein